MHCPDGKKIAFNFEGFNCLKLNGGEGGIRTHGHLAATHAFQACLIDHSSTSPYITLYSFIKICGGEGGIRTHAPLSRRPLFESSTINHSDTSPEAIFYLNASKIKSQSGMYPSLQE